LRGGKKDKKTFFSHFGLTTLQLSHYNHNFGSEKTPCFVIVHFAQLRMINITLKCQDKNICKKVHNFHHYLTWFLVPRYVFAPITIQFRTYFSSIYFTYKFFKLYVQLTINSMKGMMVSKCNLKRFFNLFFNVYVEKR
jgi:hypothetical protein